MKKEAINVAEFEFLPVAEGNRLVCTESNWKASKGMDNDDDYFDEVAPDGTVVAKYYVWHHLSTFPPFPVSEGWKKYDPAGIEIANGNVTKGR